jgi:hypothetical protein
MFLALAAAAAAYTAPVPIDRSTWIVAYWDFPKNAVDVNTYTSVAAVLTVSPHGGVSSCTAKVTAGDARMADYTCKLLRVRAHYEPARDPSGRRLYGIDRERIAWYLAKDGKARTDIPVPSDYRVTVDKLPDGAKAAAADIQFAVDQAGHATECRPYGDSESEPHLAQMACEALGPSFTAAPARDRKGQPVISVQSASVQLLAAQAQ